MGNTDSATHGGEHHHFNGNDSGGTGVLSNSNNTYFDSAPSTLQYMHNSNPRKSSQNSHHHHHHPQQRSLPSPSPLSSALPPNNETDGHQRSVGVGNGLQLPATVKVLPKFDENPPPGLRTTNNGLILHNGGTLTTKTTARALGGVIGLPHQRGNKQAIAGLPPLMKRSRTQHDLLTTTTTTATPATSTSTATGPNGWAANSRRYHYNQMRNGPQQQAPSTSGTNGKLFGSETDLTMAATGNNGNGSSSSNNSNSNSKNTLALTINNSGSKVAATTARVNLNTQQTPPQLPQRPLSMPPPQPMISVKKYSAPQPPMAFVAPVPRKLRMFKTKAESRKSSGIGAAASASTTSDGATAVQAAAATTTAVLANRQSHDISM